MLPTPLRGRGAALALALVALVPAARAQPGEGLLGFSEAPRDAELRPGPGVPEEALPGYAFEAWPGREFPRRGDFDPALDMPGLGNPGSPAHEGGNCFGICRAAWAHWVHNTERGEREGLEPSDLAAVRWRRDAYTLGQLQPTNAVSPRQWRLRVLLTTDPRRESLRRFAQVLANQWQGIQEGQRQLGDPRGTFRALVEGLEVDGLAQLSLRHADGGHSVLVYGAREGWAHLPGAEAPLRAVRFDLADPNERYHLGDRHEESFLLYFPRSQRYHLAGPQGPRYNQGGLVPRPRIGHYRPLRADDHDLDAGPFIPRRSGEPGPIDQYFW